MSDCEGRRLKPESLSVLIHGMRVTDFLGMSLDEAVDFVGSLKKDTQFELSVMRCVVWLAHLLGGGTELSTGSSI